MSLDDAAFLGAFERADAADLTWNHRAHIRMAYLMLRAYRFDDAVARIRAGIKALNAAHGIVDTAERGYHETVTVAWAHLVARAIRRVGGRHDFETFTSLAPELLDKWAPLAHYTRDRIMSPEARAAFVPADFEPLPPGERTPSRAIILAAGLGSRFGGAGDLKPLAMLDLLTLVGRNAVELAEAGVQEISVVTGHEHETVSRELRRELRTLPADVTFVFNADFRKANGLSAVVGFGASVEPALLLMADHVWTPGTLADAAASPMPNAGATLYVDSKLELVYDLDDATKVRSNEEGRVIAIGKRLADFNRVDTGLFAITRDLPDAIREVADERGDASLSDGVQALANAGLMRARGVGGARWFDVDTIEALEACTATLGEKGLTRRTGLD